jgi:hypothetical protein
MFSVILKGKDSNEISQIVKELKDHGYKIGIDFDFKYAPGKFDWSVQLEIPRQTEFIFYNELAGVHFTLKYL